jgi:hypothetical protein
MAIVITRTIPDITKMIINGERFWFSLGSDLFVEATFILAFDASIICPSQCKDATN